MVLVTAQLWNLSRAEVCVREHLAPPHGPANDGFEATHLSREI
jgi:hypothetical protein